MSRVSLLAVLSIVLVTSACSSRLNPLNWFGRDKEVKVVVQEVPGGIIDSRPLIAQIQSVRVDRAPGGAIVNTVGLTQWQGYWQPALIAENRGVPVDGVLTIQFRVAEPLTNQIQGTQASREIAAAMFLTDQELSGVRSIVIRGANNARSVRR
ncbi:hypothetical protein [Actibacterium pelagium]|uniref:Uncharacterized protein n=1 Tax=Actibacterium pelagium TaxID=2029103 RepID=A0A917EI53_9RHOB|nr:hypothetical protein [Actibacterium pelagium]GGE43545.1 hypothetical protein GCM10011517_09040 [Actibacterium pelagium]